MLIIDTFATRAAADEARRHYVSAQVVTDGVLRKALGALVEPPADDIYVVIPREGRFAIALDDPSLPEERDCGD